jgi:hypothetical protein
MGMSDELLCPTKNHASVSSYRASPIDASAKFAEHLERPVTRLKRSTDSRRAISDMPCTLAYRGADRCSIPHLLPGLVEIPREVCIREHITNHGGPPPAAAKGGLSGEFGNAQGIWLSGMGPRSWRAYKSGSRDRAQLARREVQCGAGWVLSAASRWGMGSSSADLQPFTVGSEQFPCRVFPGQGFADSSTSDFSHPFALGRIVQQPTHLPRELDLVIRSNIEGGRLS